MSDELIWELTAAETYYYSFNNETGKYDIPPKEVTYPPEDLNKEFLEKYGVEKLAPITRLFFDYDRSYDKDNDNFDVVKHKEEIFTRLKDNQHKYRYNFTTTEQPDKVSFHVIFKKINIVRNQFHPICEKEMFSTIVGEQNVKYIDDKVYGDKLWFRLPYGKVSGKPFPHIPYNPSSNMKLELENFILAVPEGSETKDYSLNPNWINWKWSKQVKVEEKEEQEHKVIEVDDVFKTQCEEAFSQLKVERFKDSKSWYLLACMMKNTGQIVETFCKMSKDSGYSKYNEKQCISTWNSISTPINYINLLRKWLKEDNGEQGELVLKERSPLLKDFLTAWQKQGAFTDLVVATILYNYYSENLIYTSQGWFHYSKKWTLGDKNSIFSPVMKLLSNHLLQYVETEMKKTVSSDDDTKEDKGNKKTKYTLLKSIQKASNELQSATKIKSVLSVAEGIFRNDDVLSTFDKKSNWFCFDNQKAYDLKTKQVIDIVASDRILTTCGYDLPERKEEDVTKVKQIILDMVPKEDYDSHVSALSLFMYGENINEKFIVFKGEGRNGKGVLISLLQKMLGKYFYALPTDVLTEHSKGAGRASPELAQTRWVRCVMSSEPDSKKEIVKTTINLLTGRDEITVRQLKMEPFTFLPQFTVGMMCNDIPNISGGINTAIKERLCIHDFPNTFLENPNEEIPTQKKMDTNMKNKVRDDLSFRNGLFYLLSDVWFTNQGKYIACESSKEEQKEYAISNNPLSEFLSSYEESKDFKRIQDLQTEYKESNYDSQLTSQQFKRFIQETGFKIEEDKKKGHKVFINKKRMTEI